VNPVDETVIIELAEVSVTTGVLTVGRTMDIAQLDMTPELFPNTIGEWILQALFGGAARSLRARTQGRNRAQCQLGECMVERGSSRSDLHWKSDSRLKNQRQTCRYGEPLPFLLLAGE